MGTLADVPTGAAAKSLPLCDLVMKGGVTSGLVYPSMVTRLATTYRFANVGGSSAGAIAAALAAAAEYGRQTDNGGGMSRLDAAADDLGGKGVLRGMFQPTPGARPLFRLIQGAFLVQSPDGAKVPVSRRLRIAAGMACTQRKLVSLVGIVLLAVLVVLAIGAFSAFSTALAVVLAVLVALLLIPLVALATVLVAAGLLIGSTLNTLGESDYGVCPGSNQGRPETAVIDWLHGHIQDCAGRKDEGAPLTFRDLDAQGIRLTMLTTDLSFARPVRVPEGIGDYRFDPVEMRERFPAAVVDAMVKAGKPDGDGHHVRMPTADLPVLVGVRLSLSFPLLLSAMRLYWPDDRQGGELRRHLFSDGGIGSNFPVHLFDVWFPGRPTFAIDLVDYPEGDTRDVVMLSDPSVPLVPRWNKITSLFAFVGDIKDAMQNWRDTLQSELPGFRDRVCQIRVKDTEGGLHLDMSPAMIKLLVDRGKEAGDEILKTFDAHQWEQHRYVRYLTLMGQVQDSLHRADQPFGDFAPGLKEGLPAVTVYRTGRDAAWCQRAEQATASLLSLGDQWGPPPLGVDFLGPDRPLPEAATRVVPRA
jgi:predicted acylesterase/phospholipase RssA